MGQVVIPTGFVQVTFHYQLPNDLEDMLTSIGLAVTDVVDIVDAQGLAESWAGWQSTLVGGNYVLSQMDVLIGSGAPPYVKQEFPITGVGFGGTATIPQNSSYLVKKITLAAGHSQRGRMFVPGVIEGKVSNAGAIASGDVSTANDGLDDFRLYAEGTAPWDGLFLLHSSDSPALAATAISQLLLDSRIATQRRRLRP